MAQVLRISHFTKQLLRITTTRSNLVKRNGWLPPQLWNFRPPKLGVEGWSWITNILVIELKYNRYSSCEELISQKKKGWYNHKCIQIRNIDSRSTLSPLEAMFSRKESRSLKCQSERYPDQADWRLLTWIRAEQREIF